MPGPDSISRQSSLSGTHAIASASATSETSSPPPSRDKLPSRLLAVPAKTLPVPPGLHRNVLAAHEAHEAGMQQYFANPSFSSLPSSRHNTDPNFPSSGSSHASVMELVRIRTAPKQRLELEDHEIANAATELGELRSSLRALEKQLGQQEEAKTQPAGDESQLSGHPAAAIRKQRTKLLQQINQKTLILEGRIVASELSRGRDLESLVYGDIANKVVSAIDASHQETDESANGAKSSQKNNGYQRLFADHPSFREAGIDGQVELAAVTHKEITRMAKELETLARQGGGDHQFEAECLKLSSQLVKNTVAKLIDEHKDDLVDQPRAEELVNAINNEDFLTRLDKKHQQESKIPVLAFTVIAGVIGAFFHYAVSRVGTEEKIKNSNGYDKNNYGDVATMALASGLVLGLTYFFANKTVGRVAKGLVEKIPFVEPRAPQKTSADKAIPAPARTIIQDGVPKDLSATEFQKEMRLTAGKRKVFSNIGEHFGDGGIAGAVLGFMSVGAISAGRAWLQDKEYVEPGLVARVIGTLVGTGLEAGLQTDFKMRQKIVVDGREIPAYTKGDAKGVRQHLKEGMESLRDHPAAFRDFLMHLAGGVASTELSNLIVYLSRNADNTTLKMLANFAAAAMVVAPMYAATELGRVKEIDDGHFSGTKTALKAITAPEDSRLTQTALDDSDSVQFSKKEWVNKTTKLATRVHTVGSGIQSVVPHAMADTIMSSVVLCELFMDGMDKVDGMVKKANQARNRPAEDSTGA